MDIPREMLEVFKCSICELYLSQGPVYLQHDGAAACGRCCTPRRPATRNTQYEIMARLLNLKFPCKYEEMGCLKTVSYVGQDEVMEHEEVCKYRLCVSPMHCFVRNKWLGRRRRATMLAHGRDQSPVIEKCAGCAVEVTVFRYQGMDGWRCERCVPAKRACENQDEGCTHTDIDDKCWKHEWYFCQQRTTCNICNASVSRGSLSAHFDSAHQYITHQAGSMWRARPGGWHYCLVSSIAGTAVCEYELLALLFELYVHIPVAYEQLSEFRCEVRLTDLATGHARTFTPDVEYNQMYDWRIVVKQDEFAAFNGRLGVYVEIRKAES